MKKIFFFNFFMFCDRMDVEKPQRVPPFSFSALWDFSAPGARASEPRRATRSIFLVCNFFKKNFSKNFRFSSTVKEYLTLGSLFAIFEPWIWRRLGPVPACLIYTHLFSIYTHKLFFFNTIRNFDVTSGVKRYIRIFDVISELDCVFSRRFSEEKCPTLTVASFFFVRCSSRNVCTNK